MAASWHSEPSPTPRSAAIPLGIPETPCRLAAAGGADPARSPIYHERLPEDDLHGLADPGCHCGQGRGARQERRTERRILASFTHLPHERAAGSQRTCHHRSAGLLLPIGTAHGVRCGVRSLRSQCPAPGKALSRVVETTGAWSPVPSSRLAHRDRRGDVLQLRRELSTKAVPPTPGLWIQAGELLQALPPVTQQVPQDWVLTIGRAAPEHARTRGSPAASPRR